MSDRPISELIIVGVLCIVISIGATDFFVHRACDRYYHEHPVAVRYTEVASGIVLDLDERTSKIAYPKHSVTATIYVDASTSIREGDDPIRYHAVIIHPQDGGYYYCRESNPLSAYCPEYSESWKWAWAAIKELKPVNGFLCMFAGDGRATCAAY